MRKARPGMCGYVCINTSVHKSGCLLFLNRMFTEHPDTKSYFTHFKGMDSAEEMKQSDQVRGHGKKVFSAINDMVQHLDNSEAFLGIVTPLGKKHATQLKIDPKNFRVSEQPSSLCNCEEGMFSPLRGRTAEHRLFMLEYIYMSQRMEVVEGEEVGGGRWQE